MRAALDHGECWNAGFEIGKKANLGDDLPHPTHWGEDYDHHDTFYEAIRAALHLRDLDVSMFLRVIPALGGAN